LILNEEYKQKIQNNRDSNARALHVNISSTIEKRNEKVMSTNDEIALLE
jgi:hypothetical protein